MSAVLPLRVAQNDPDVAARRQMPLDPRSPAGTSSLQSITKLYMVDAGAMTERRLLARLMQFLVHHGIFEAKRVLC